LIRRQNTRDGFPFWLSPVLQSSFHNSGDGVRFRDSPLTDDRLAGHSNFMDSGASVRVTYWAEQAGDHGLINLDGIDAFRDELAEHYVSVVHVRAGDLGGLLQLTVEFVSHISLADVAQFLASGVAYDVIKGGANALVLRPFIEAYRRLKERNSHTRVDVETLRLVLRDSVVVIYQISEDSIFQHLERIPPALAEEYQRLVLRSGEQPFEIHVPVFEDPENDRLSRFRVLLDVDETIKPNATSDYLGFWVLQYDFSSLSVGPDGGLPPRALTIEAGLDVGGSS